VRGPRTVIAAVLLAGAGCGGDTPIPAEDLLVRVASPADSVDLGRAFPLTVVRVWSKDVAPEPWADGALAPLALRPLDVTTREDGGRVEETRRFAAYAFRPGRVVLPGATFAATPRSGGAARTATGNTVELHVRGALQGSSPAAPELPGDPLEPPVRAWLWVGGATAAIASLLVVRRRRRTVATLELPPSSPPDAAQLALERLAAIRERAAADAAADFVAVAAVLRTYVASRLGIRVVERTSEEIVRDVRARDDTHADELEACLGFADLVKFAKASPGPAERDVLVESAESFVRSGPQ
jgi:hypothetical protein